MENKLSQEKITPEQILFITGIITFPFIFSISLIFVNLAIILYLIRNLSGFIKSVFSDNKNYFLLTFAVLTIIFSPFTINPERNLAGFTVRYLYVFIVFLFVKAIYTDRLKEIILKSIVYSSFLITCIGLFQFMNKGFYLRYFPSYDSDGMLPFYLIDILVLPFRESHYRIYSLFYAPPMLGVYLSLVIPLIIYYAFYSKSKIERYFISVNLVLTFIVLYLSYTRIAWISVLTGILYYSKITGNIKLLIYSLIPFPVLISVISFFRPEAISLGIERFNSFFSLSYFSNYDRIIIWSRSFDAFKKHFLTGTGNFSFWNIFPEYRWVFPHSHNYALHTLLENGLILTVILFGFYFLIVYRVQKDIENQSNKKLTYALFCSVISFFITGIADYPSFEIRNNFLFWVLLSLI